MEKFEMAESEHHELGGADTGLNWDTVLRRLTPEEHALIQEDEFGITEESYERLSEHKLAPITTAVDARYAPEFVDKGLRDAVKELDKLPFVKSSNGCTGHSLEHLLHRLAERQKIKSDSMHNPHSAEEWKAIMTPYGGGYWTMYLDLKDERSYKFADEAFRLMQKFTREHPDMIVKFKLLEDEDKPGVATFGFSWDVLPPAGWLKEHKGVEDLPLPTLVVGQEAAARLIKERQLEYPFGTRRMNDWLIYDHIYSYLYHDFYVDNQAENKEKSQSAIEELADLAKQWQGVKFSGDLVADRQAETAKYDVLEKYAEQVESQDEHRRYGWQGMTV